MPIESQSPTQADRPQTTAEVLAEIARDARRYRRLRALGCVTCGIRAPAYGKVLRFTSLDKAVDADLANPALRPAELGEPVPCRLHRDLNCPDCQAGEPVPPFPRPMIPNIEPLKPGDLGAYETVIPYRHSSNVDIPRAEVALELAEHFQFAQPPAEFNEQLRLWLTFHTLAHLFQKAWSTASGPNNQRDRLMLKWNEYVALAKWARTLYFKAADKAQKGGAA